MKSIIYYTYNYINHKYNSYNLNIAASMKGLRCSSHHILAVLIEMK